MTMTFILAVLALSLPIIRGAVRARHDAVPAAVRDFQKPTYPGR